MRVLLIGCGAVGAVIASHLDRDALTTELGLADLRLRAARDIASRLGGGKASPLQLDVNDAEELKEGMQGVDLVVNASLPSLNNRVMEAALEAEACYIDLAFDGDGPFDQDARWKQAGLTALVGCGEDPGISNVLAVEATKGLEAVDSLRVIDGETSTSSQHPFTLLFSPATFLKEALGQATLFEEGRLRHLPPFSGEEFYEFPPPVGPVPVYNMDHEEVRTLPRFLDRPARRVEFKLALDPKVLQVLKVVKALDLMSPRPVRVGEAEVSPKAVLLAIIPRPDELRGKVQGYAALAVEAQGEMDGRRVSRRLLTLMDHREAHRLHDATATAYLTGTGAAVAAHMLLSGLVKGPGILPTERLNSQKFLSLLEELGVHVQREERRE